MYTSVMWTVFQSSGFQMSTCTPTTRVRLSAGGAAGARHADGRELTRTIWTNVDIYINQLLGVWFRIYLFFCCLVFCDKSDDLVEVYLAILAEFLRPK